MCKLVENKILIIEGSRGFNRYFSLMKKKRQQIKWKKLDWNNIDIKYIQQNN